MDPALPGTRIRINVQAKTEDGRANREERAKALKAQARDYLLKHNIEERLSDAVKALLKEQPKDPTNFLCNHLRAEAELPKAEAAPAEPQAEDPGCQIFEDDELNAIRKQSRDAFLQASEDGNLERALRELRPGVTEEAASKELTEAEKEKAKKDAIRAKASNVLINAAENGDLERALQLVKTDSQAQAPAPAAEFRPDGPQQAARDDAQPEFRSYYAQHVRTVAPDSMQKLYANFPGQPKPAPAAHDEDQSEFRSYYSQHVRTVAPESMQKLYADFPGQRQPVPAEDLDPGCQIFEDDELNAIRKQSRDVFLQASEDGNLERALRELRPGVTEEEVGTKELTEAEKQKAKKDAIRAKASNVLINAAGNGDLERALQNVKTDSQAPAPAADQAPAPAARDDAQSEFRSYYAQHVRTVAPDSMQKLYANFPNFPGQPKPAPAQVSGGAEVAADSKAILLRDPAVTGPPLMALGMQPGLQFI